MTYSNSNSWVQLRRPAAGGRSAAVVALFIALVLHVPSSAFAARQLHQQQQHQQQKRLLQQQQQHTNAYNYTTASQCLWSVRATAVATATTASSAGTATATASASATATATATTAASCLLNPSLLLAAPSPTLPPLKFLERLSAALTAVRRECQAYATPDACDADGGQSWCAWHDDNNDGNGGGNGRCALTVDDADVLAMLLWSRSTRLACRGSPLERLVNCSFAVSEDACASLDAADSSGGGGGGCTWAEGACYLQTLVPILTKPRAMAAWKAQVLSADAAVWGACEGRDAAVALLSVCSAGAAGPEACAAAAGGGGSCVWLGGPAYEADVLPNPLNMSAACVLAAHASPVESVFLSAAAAAAVGGGGGDAAASATTTTATTTTATALATTSAAATSFSGAVFAAQKACVTQGAASAAACLAVGSIRIDGGAEAEALAYSPATEPPLAAAASASAAVSAPASTFAAAWADMTATMPATTPTPLQALAAKGKKTDASDELDGGGGWFMAAAAGSGGGGCSTPATCAAVSLSRRKLRLVSRRRP